MTIRFYGESVSNFVRKHQLLFQTCSKIFWCCQQEWELLLPHSLTRVVSVLDWDCPQRCWNPIVFSFSFLLSFVIFKWTLLFLSVQWRTGLNLQVYLLGFKFENIPISNFVNLWIVWWKMTTRIPNTYFPKLKDDMNKSPRNCQIWFQRFCHSPVLRLLLSHFNFIYLSSLIFPNRVVLMEMCHSILNHLKMLQDWDLKLPLKASSANC